MRRRSPRRFASRALSLAGRTNSNYRRCIFASDRASRTRALAQQPIPLTRLQPRIIMSFRAIARRAVRAGSPRTTRRLSQNDRRHGRDRARPKSTTRTACACATGGAATASARKALILIDYRIDRSLPGALTMICRNSEKYSTKRNIMLQGLECIGSVLGDVPWVTRIMCPCAGAH